MKRKILSILLALVLVLSFSLVTAVPAAATTGIWYVDAGAATGGDGTTAALTDVHCAFQTISGAITAASSGDTINVAAGTYTEQLLIKKDLILTGAGIGQTIVKAPTSGRATFPGRTRWFDLAGASTGSTVWSSDYILAAYPTNWDGSTLTGTPISVKVTGFTFDANGQTYTTGAARFTGVFFGSVKGTDIGDAGLFASAVQGFPVTGNATINAATGVRILGDSMLTIDHNTVGYTINGIASYGDASSAPDPLVAVSYNTVNYLQSASTGSDEQAIVFSSGATGTIDHNTMLNGVTGIALCYAATGCTISNNTLSDLTLGLAPSPIQPSSDGVGGIVLNFISTGNSITGNSVTNSKIGIFVGDGSSNNTFTGNTITNNPIGAQVDKYAGGADPTGLVFHNNSFVGNTVGFDNNETTSVDAENNWWGTAVGAEIAALVSGSVDYDPWLHSAPSSVTMTAQGQAATQPVVTTNDATAVNLTVATLNGNLADKGSSVGGPLVSFVYGMNSVTTPSGSKGGYTTETTPSQKGTIGDFTAALTTLSASQTYYFRAKAQPSDMTDPVYGAEESFITTIATTPTVTTLGVTNIGVTTATLNGRLAIGGTSSVSVYLAYSTSSYSATPATYTWNAANPAAMTASGDFAFSVTGLSANTQYYFMAKGVVGGVDYYGTELTFTTQQRIGVSVSTTSISFGDIIAGHSSTPQTMTVTNTGTASEKLTASLANESPASFYTQNLKIDTLAVSAWNATTTTAVTPGLILSIPIGYAAGAKTATLIFWAELQ